MNDDDRRGGTHGVYNALVIAVPVWLIILILLWRYT
jgi:hypothetical protein